MKAPTNTQRGFLGKPESANYSGLSMRTLDAAKLRGDLPFYRFGSRKVLFKIDDLDKWLSAMRVDVGQDDRGAVAVEHS